MMKEERVSLVYYGPRTDLLPPYSYSWMDKIADMDRNANKNHPIKYYYNDEIGCRTHLRRYWVMYIDKKTEPFF